MDIATLVSIGAAVVSATTTIVLAALTARYVKLTHALVEEAKAAKIPSVYVDLELDPGLSKFVLGNAGNSPALNIELQVLRDAPWESIASMPTGLANLAPFKNGIAYLAPSRVLKFAPGSIQDDTFFSIGSRIEIRLSYETETGRRLVREVSFDLSSYDGVMLESFRDPQTEVAKAIRDAAWERRKPDLGRPLRRAKKKICPSCGERVAITATTCRFCKAAIATLS